MPLANQVPSNQSTGYPFQTGNRLYAYHLDSRNRLEQFTRWLMAQGMDQPAARAFVWRMSGTADYAQPDTQRRDQYIAEDWLRRHTFKLNGIPKTPEYLTYQSTVNKTPPEWTGGVRRGTTATNQIINYVSKAAGETEKTFLERESKRLGVPPNVAKTHILSKLQKKQEKKAKAVRALTLTNYKQSLTNSNVGIHVMVPALIANYRKKQASFNEFRGNRSDVTVGGRIDPEESYDRQDGKDWKVWQGILNKQAKKKDKKLDKIVKKADKSSFLQSLLQREKSGTGEEKAPSIRPTVAVKPQEMMKFPFIKPANMGPKKFQHTGDEGENNQEKLNKFIKNPVTNVPPIVSKLPVGKKNIPVPSPTQN